MVVSRPELSEKVVCIVCNEYSPEAVTARDVLKTYLGDLGIQLVEPAAAPGVEDHLKQLDHVDLLICLGGDGSLLKVNIFLSIH